MCVCICILVCVSKVCKRFFSPSFLLFLYFLANAHGDKCSNLHLYACDICHPSIKQTSRQKTKVKLPVHFCYFCQFLYIYSMQNSLSAQSTPVAGKVASRCKGYCSNFCAPFAVKLSIRRCGTRFFS